MGKTCNKCGTKNLDWNKKNYELTGKWKLQDHRDKEGQWCVKAKKPEYKIATKENVILCEYCRESNFGLCRTKEDYEHHVRAYHPNKEILTTLDYMFISCGLKGVDLENWISDSHYEKYKKHNNTTFISTDIEELL